MGLISTFVTMKTNTLQYNEIYRPTFPLITASRTGPKKIYQGTCQDQNTAIVKVESVGIAGIRTTAPICIDLIICY